MKGKISAKMSQDLIPHKRAWNYTGMLVMSENKTPG
jgi:hypothetical protein